MLNPFPIQFLSMLAYLALRLFVGGFLILFGYTHYKSRKRLAKKFKMPIFPFGNLASWIFVIGELVLGAMFVLGLYTQIAALFTMAMSLKLILLHKRFGSLPIQSRSFYTLLFAAALSLFITGAGAFAFDLPI